MALKSVLMDVKHYSEIDTPFTMIEVMNRINVILGKGPLLKSIGRSDYILSQDYECVEAMMKIPYGEVTGMSRDHTLDGSDKSVSNEGN